MKNRIKQWISCLLAFGILFNAIPNTAFAAIEVKSPLVINEIVPDTDNVGGSDGYEFFEIQNVSDSDQNIENYSIRYNVNDIWALDDPSIVLPPKGTLTVWIKSPALKDLKDEDFNNYYQTNLVRGKNFTTVQSNGFHNSKQRDLAILTKTGQELVIARYNHDDIKLVQKTKGINFLYNSNTIMEDLESYDAQVSPGVSNANQILDGTFTNALHTDGEVSIQAPTKLAFNTSFQLSLTQSKFDLLLSADLKITGDDGEVKTYPLLYDEGKFAVSVPFADLSTYKSFQWEVVLSNGHENYVSSSKTTKVQQGELDRSKFPIFLITEITPDTENMGGADAYEFIEVTNNSDKTLNFKDYQLVYNYPDNGPDNNVQWFASEKDLLVEAGESIVFWVKNGKNDSLTIDDFNKKHGTDLDMGKNLFEIHQGGMANGSRRGLYVMSRVGDVVDYIIYNDNGADNTFSTTSIVYTLNTETLKNELVTDQAEVTPGIVPEEYLSEYAEYKEATEAPSLIDHTPTSFDNEEKLVFAIEAKGQGSDIKSVKLGFQDDLSSEMQYFQLTRDQETPDLFVYSLNPIDLTAKSYYDYQFVVSDGTNELTTDTKRVQSTSPQLEEHRVNHSDLDILTGKDIVTTTGQELFFDGKNITSETRPTISDKATFVFEASQTDSFFKNAVAIGDNVLGIFDDGTYGDWKTYSYPISPSFITKGKDLVVDIHAGNKSNPLVHDVENNDDFVVKNIRLVLPNGRQISPKGYENPEELIKMGDSSGKIEILNATFAIPDKFFDAIGYEFDSKAFIDGEHTFLSKRNREEKAVKLIFDNMGPEIVTNLEEGKEYKKFDLSLDLKDAYSEVVKSVIKLDGKKITSPYPIRSTEIQAGEHILSIYAVDAQGNVTEKEMKFTTPQENPVFTELSPKDGEQVEGKPHFIAKLEDSSCDDLTIYFKKGESYSLGQKEVVVRKGVSDRMGSSEDVFDQESMDGFPFEIYEVSSSKEATSDGQVRIEWTGQVDSEKVNLFALHSENGTWDKLKVNRSGDEEVVLKAMVEAKDYVKDGKITFMIQNGEGYTPKQYEKGAQALSPQYSHITSSNKGDKDRASYDFTFIIESDTQYYNEDVPTNPNIIGKYQYQLDIHDWVIANTPRMNIQYLFHTGDIIDDNEIIEEWGNADKAYRQLEEAGLAYGILAGNHDVSHKKTDYTNFSNYFGQARFQNQPYYGSSYKNNRGHYDLITVDGIDFLMLYMGWEIGDEEIDWMNEVLKEYPERKAILNFHEYLLASGGLGEQPQRINNEVIAQNPNVVMVLSGHYHNAQRVETPYDDDHDGKVDRKVQQLLFDYQGLTEGGMGYIRMMHWDNASQTVTVKTYSPSLDDYDAKDYPNINAQSIVGEEEFVIPYEDLAGLNPQKKQLGTKNLVVSFDSEEIIGEKKVSGCKPTVEFVWENPSIGQFSWFAEAVDAFGGRTRSKTQTITVKEEKPDVSEEPEPEDPKPSIPSDLPKGPDMNLDGTGLKIKGYTRNDVYVRLEKGSDEYIEILPMGTKVEGFVDGAWVRFERNGKMVYIAQFILIDHFPSTEINGYLKDSIYVRAQKGDKDILAIYAAGKKVTGFREGAWIRILHEGQVAYIASRFIVETNLVDGNTTSSLYVRPEKNSQKHLGILSKGANVHGVLEGAWIKISYKGQTAYIAKKFVQ